MMISTIRPIKAKINIKEEKLGGSVFAIFLEMEPEKSPEDLMPHVYMWGLEKISKKIGKLAEHAKKIYQSHPNFLYVDRGLNWVGVYFSK